MCVCVCVAGVCVCVCGGGGGGVGVKGDIFWFVLGFNDTSTLEGHFCCLPEKGK